jgi:hypothetical protein
MRNLVAKHARTYNRATVYKDRKTSYNRNWSIDWDEIEPPKEF